MHGNGSIGESSELSLICLSAESPRSQSPKMHYNVSLLLGLERDFLVWHLRAIGDTTPSPPCFFHIVMSDKSLLRLIIDRYQNKGLTVILSVTY